MNDLSMHVLDIVQNSVSAGAKLIQVIIKINSLKDILSIEIDDNGKGMSAEKLEKLADPFFTSRTTRKVGLGIPLLKQTAEQSGGDVFLESQVGVGTKVLATFRYMNIDRPPLGDIANAIMLLVSSNPEIDFIFSYSKEENEYVFNTLEVKEVLGEIQINNITIFKYLEEMINEGINSL